MPTTELTSLIAKADALSAQGKYQEALALLNEARHAHSENALLYSKMADLFDALGQTEAATRLYGDALARAPNAIPIVRSAGLFFYKSDQCAKGYALLKNFAARADCPQDILLLYAHLAKGASHADEARQIYKAILAREENNISALNSLGTLALDEGDKDAAITYLEKALHLAPHEAQIEMHLAHAYFRRGQNNDLEKGWQHYAARFSATATPRPFAQSKWQGEMLKNETLLLWGEQGIGEEILYAGLLADAQKYAQHLVVECDARLVPLFSRSFEGIRFIARRDPPDALALKTDFQAPLGQLGALFRKNLSDFPPAQPYLKADPHRVENFKKKYAALKSEKKCSGKTIGVSWKSQKLRHGDPKSTPFALWEKLFTGSPHLFVNIQDGDCLAEKEMAHAKNWNFITDESVNQRASLEEYAAQLAALDMVITVSNSTAHMAGALGVPTYVLLPKSRGLMWHWFEGLDKAPWYSNASLLRQTVDGDWQGPLDEIGNTISHA